MIITRKVPQVPPGEWLLPRQTISHLDRLYFDCATSSDTFNCTNNFFDPYLPIHHITFMALRFVLYQLATSAHYQLLTSAHQLYFFRHGTQGLPYESCFVPHLKIRGAAHENDKTYLKNCSTFWQPHNRSIRHHLRRYQIPKGTPSSGALNTRGWEKLSIFDGYCRLSRNGARQADGYYGKLIGSYLLNGLNGIIFDDIE